MDALLDAPDVQASDAALELPQGNVREPGDFPEEEFLTIPNVPVFAEHKTMASDDREINFGYHELKLVADRCNRRIAESGDYAAVCIGHTPKPEAKASGAADPDVVGFAGPFRMGRIGQAGTRQRHAILADFHIFRDDVTRFKKHPRRSPELWLEDSYDEMFLDPIALLGAEAPRLDLGLLYSAVLHRNGRQVLREKYTAVAPGPSNVFIPDAGDQRRYSPSADEDTQMDVNDDLVARICEAIGQTDEMKFVQKMMAEQSGGMAGGEVAMDVPSPAMASVEPPAPPAASPAGPDPMNQGPPEGPPPVPPEDEDPTQNMRHMKTYAAMDEMEDDELEQYMSRRRKGHRRMGSQGKYEAGSGNAAGEYQTANQSELGSGKQERSETSGAPTPYQAEGSADGSRENPSGTGTANGSMEIATGSVDEANGSGSNAASTYSRNGHGNSVLYQRLQVELRTQSDRSDKLEQSLVIERNNRINAERYQRLQGLQLEGFTLDPQDEMERLSADKMSTEQFDETVKSITEHYQRMPTVGLPYSAEAVMNDPGRPGSRNEQERYSRACGQRAEEICMSIINQGGDQPNFVTILDEVKAGKHGEVLVA